jgi:hypothetical protein
MSTQARRVFSSISRLIKNPSFSPFIFLFLIFITIVAYLETPRPSENKRELLLLLIGTLTVHLVDRFILFGSFETLIEKTANSVKDVFSDLSRSADCAGIVHIYQDREAASEDVLKAVGNAEKRVWLIGIAFTGEPDLSHLISRILLSKQKHPHVDIRLLLLDPLKSPAVFRAILESPANTLESILTEARRDPPNMMPLLNQQLYLDCAHAAGTLANLDNSFLQRVKYYAHTPTAWMIIADSIAYFQPYSLGRPPKYGIKNGRFGPHMPVFKLKANSDAGTFEVFYDHFDKLWSTSDTEYSDFSSRWEDRVRITSDIINARYSWFAHVCNAVSSNIPTDQKRRWPRQKCPEDIFVALRWRDEETKAAFEREGVVVDSSSGNIAVKIKRGLGMPGIGQHISLTSAEKPATLAGMSRLRKYVGADLIVTRLEEDIVALEIVQKARSYTASSNG